MVHFVIYEDSHMMYDVNETETIEMCQLYHMRFHLNGTVMYAAMLKLLDINIWQISRSESYSVCDFYEIYFVLLCLFDIVRPTKTASIKPSRNPTITFHLLPFITVLILSKKKDLVYLARGFHFFNETYFVLLYLLDTVWPTKTPSIKPSRNPTGTFIFCLLLQS